MKNHFIAICLFSLFSFINTYSNAQVNEDFSDGNLSSNPIWVGDTSEFKINTSLQLQLNNTVAGASYTSTANTMPTLNNMEWRVYVKQTFAGSGSNYGRVYLVSDQQDLEGSLNGYFLQFGEAGSNDVIELFKQTGTTNTSVCRANKAKIVNTTNSNIKVLRDNAGSWTVFADSTGGTNLLQIAAGVETTFNSSSWYGVSTTYTSSNSTKFFFDDISVAAIVQDTIKPSVSSVSVLSDSTIDLLFSEPVEITSANLNTNYFINGGIGNPTTVARDGSNLSLVHITSGIKFIGGSNYVIRASNIKDVTGNFISTADSASFTYTAPVIANSKDLVISEIYANNGTANTTLTGKGEFVEIYNVSNKTFNLNGWKLTTTNSSGTVATKTVTSSTIIQPGNYVTLCVSSDTTFYNTYGKTASLSSTPLLTNSGMKVTLFSNIGKQIDMINYSDTWYNNTTKKNGGYTLERINSTDTCLYQVPNWTASNDTLGGTPGDTNSVQSFVNDNTGPLITSVGNIVPNGIQLCFSEGLDSAIATNISNYVISGGIIISSALPQAPDFTCVNLTFSNSINTTTNYTVTINNLTDCRGNLIIANSQIPFNNFPPVAAGPKDIIINEIYADNTSTPNNTAINGKSEFVEIFNRSSKTISLKNWVLYTKSPTSATSSTCTINSFLSLGPNQYAILCTATDSTFYQSFAGGNNKTAILSGAPTLNNSGMIVTLKDNSGKIIDKITYSDTWYNSTPKKDGAYTLERINSSDTCANQQPNWSGCNDAGDGGTPGKINSIYTATTDITGPIVSSYYINGLSVSLCFNEGLDSLSAAANLNYVFNNGITVSTTTPLSPDFTCVKLDLNAAFDTSLNYNITINNVADCRSNLIIANTIVPLDVDPPLVSSVAATAINKVTLTFNEAVDSLLAVTLVNYVVSNSIGSPTTITKSAGIAQFNLTFATNFISGLANTITINNIKDSHGNVAASIAKTFTYTAPPPAGSKSLVINEIYADPSSTPNQTNLNGEGEFVEVYNRSNKTFLLKNWTLTTGTTVRTITSSTSIAPGEYAILCATADTAFYQTYGKTATLSSAPALTNGGMSLKLSDNTNSLVDKITYSDTWYGSTAKKDGAYTLERINSNDTCQFQVPNWTASKDSADGGTPGDVNSVKSLVVDNTGPTISIVSTVTDYAVTICFNEGLDSLNATPISNYILTSNPSSITNTISTVTPIGPDFTCVRINFANKLDTLALYTMTVLNITDCRGNLIVTGLGNSVQFNLSPPPKRGEIIINEIMADPDPVVGLPNKEYIELFNSSTKNFNINNLVLTIGSSAKTISSKKPLLAGAHVLICNVADTTFFKTISNVATVSSLLSLTNSGATVKLSVNATILLDKVDYKDSWYHDADKMDGGWSIERINPKNICENSGNNWSASTNVKGGTPGELNSVFNEDPDTKAPELLSISVVDSNTIIAILNETLDTNATNASNANHYSIQDLLGNSMITITSAKPISTAYNTVELTLKTNLSMGYTYKLVITGVNDCKGNSSNVPLAMDFGLYQIPKTYEVLINEIMVDPDPIVKLPNAEYVEFYNKSSQILSLKNCALICGSYTEVIPESYIKPGEYLILTDDNVANLFKPYGNVVGLLSFPSPSNTEGRITLRDPEGKIIHSINYSDNLYNSNVKKNGGWSIEQIDFANPCGDFKNWTGSMDPNGGTPGKVNSVYKSNADLLKPELSRINVIDNKTIEVVFNESIDSTAIYQPLSFNVDQNAGAAISVDPIEADYKKVKVVFATPFDSTLIYTLSITASIKDCAGNLYNTSVTGKFAIPKIAKPGDVVINEIMTDPLTGGSDYVELYNKSTKTIDLYFLSLADLEDTSRTSTNNTIANNYVCAPEHFLLFPNSYALLSKDIEFVKKSYTILNPNALISSTLPSLNTDFDQLALIDYSGNLIEKLNYTSKQHFALLNSTKNISLERVSYNRPAQDFTNWHSAAEQKGFGTPGYINSQLSLGENFGNDVNISPATFSPDNDGYNDVVNISVKSPNISKISNISIYTGNGRLVRVLLQNTLLGSENIFSWDGISDRGDKCAIGVYIILVEIYDLEGNVKQIKNTCVLAGKF